MKLHKNTDDAEYAEIKMINELNEALYRFVEETGLQPKKVHLSGKQIAELKNELDSIMIKTGESKEADSILGMLLIISDVDGPSFSA